MTSEVKITKWFKNCSVAWVDQNCVQVAIDAVKEGKADGLGVSPHMGYKSDDISFIDDLDDVRGLALPCASNYNLNHLYNLKNLQFLGVIGSKQAFVYEAFEQLRELRIEWNSKMILPDASSPLQKLYIRGYKPRSKGLEDIPEYKELNDIELVRGNLTKLKGIEKLKGLVAAQFSYLTNLQLISPLTALQVENLHFEACKKILDIENLTECKNLKRLAVNNCGAIQSLSFLKDFRILEDFRFVNTIIEDSDMSPLLGMKSVGFMKRKGYSHTPDEIRNIITQ